MVNVEPLISFDNSTENMKLNVNVGGAGDGGCEPKVALGQEFESPGLEPKLILYKDLKVLNQISYKNNYYCSF